VSIDLDPSLIQKFRDKVSKRVFIDKYHNVDGRNLWNVTCSAMDWISVVVEGLPHVELNPKGLGPDHRQTLNLMQYILGIDNMLESIRQLYRVLYRQDTYPLSNDKSVFQQSKISDDTYFKHIRAVFATHPVNLHSIDGVRQDTNEKFFASWAALGIGRDNDYTVFLYSSNPEKDEAIQFGVSIPKVNSYAEARYALLYQLMVKVDEICGV